MSAPNILYKIPSATSKMRLFCLPYAGGSATFYRDWQKALPAAIDVLPVELPGRGMLFNQPAFNAMLPLVEYLADALAPWLDHPFAFFGHSMGALISFELTRFLSQTRRAAPMHLFISAQRAPHLPIPLPHTYTRSDEELWAEIAALNGVPQEVLDNPQLMELLIPALRGDLTLCGTYTYVPGPELTCSLTVLGGMHDPLAERSQLEAWRSHTTATMTIQMLAGDHFFLHTSQALVLRFLTHECTALMSTLYS